MQKRFLFFPSSKATRSVMLATMPRVVANAAGPYFGQEKRIMGLIYELLAIYRAEIALRVLSSSMVAGGLKELSDEVNVPSCCVFGIVRVGWKQQDGRRYHLGRRAGPV